MIMVDYINIQNIQKFQFFLIFFFSNNLILWKYVFFFIWHLFRLMNERMWSGKPKCGEGEVYFWLRIVYVTVDVIECSERLAAVNCYQKY